MPPESPDHPLMVCSQNNRIPDTVHTIHMIAACGTGMGALACMLQELGYKVTGSDQNVYPPMSTFLEAKGIRLFKGFRAENLAHQPDLVVIGNAVSRGNPEAEAVLAGVIPFCSMPQALNHFGAAGKKKIVVTGTHGKTTTASLIAHILHHAGLDPSFMIGGILKGFDSNYRIGKGPHMVIEGDEYDTAFFDKGPKFMHYVPDTAILTGVEFDHADIFTDLEEIKRHFRQFVAQMPEGALILACTEKETLTDILPAADCSIQRYGMGEGEGIGRERSGVTDRQWECSSVMGGRDGSSFRLTTPEHEIHTIHTPMMGRHNALNMTAAFGAARRADIEDALIIDALATFGGVKRRQEIRGIKRGITVMDDFAHHPSAVKETIAAVKPFYKNGRVIAVFEPRTNSSMRDIFQDDYPAAFDGADLVCIREPSMLSKIPENQRISTKKLVADVAQRGIDAYSFENSGKIVDYLLSVARSGDLLLIMSNGGFDNIHDTLLERLE